MIYCIGGPMDARMSPDYGPEMRCPEPQKELKRLCDYDVNDCVIKVLRYQKKFTANEIPYYEFDPKSQ